MLDTDRLELDTIQERGNIVIDTSNDILLHRLATIPDYPQFNEYRNNLSNTIERINSPHPRIEGIMFESLFYLACKEALPLDIKISDGLEDTRGIDFFITSSTKSFPIDVTLSKEKYPKKLQNTDIFTLLLPEDDIYSDEIRRGKQIEGKTFIENIYQINMKILANKDSRFQINKIIRKRSKTQPISKTSTLSKYKNLKKPNWKDNKQKLIVLSNGEYNQILSFLSIFNNLNP